MRYSYVPESIAATDAAVARDMVPPPPPPVWRVLQAATPVEVDDDRVPRGARAFAMLVAELGAGTRITWSLAETAEGGQQASAVVVRVLDGAGTVAAYAAWHDGRSAGAVIDTAEGPRRIGLRQLERALAGEPEPEPAETPARAAPLQLPCRHGCGKIVRYKKDLLTPYAHKCETDSGKEGAR